MSIQGKTPYYLVVSKSLGRELTYKLISPGGLSDTVVSGGVASSFEFMLCSVRPLLPAWQDSIDWVTSTNNPIDEWETPFDKFGVYDKSLEKDTK